MKRTGELDWVSGGHEQNPKLENDQAAELFPVGSTREAHEGEGA